MIISPAFAAPITASDVGLTITSVNSFTTTLVSAFIGLVGLMFFIFLLIGGIKYIMSAGDKAAVTSAQKTITYALIGVVLTASAWGIAVLLQNITGMSILNITI